MYLLQKSDPTNSDKSKNLLLQMFFRASSSMIFSRKSNFLHFLPESFWSKTQSNQTRENQKKGKAFSFKSFILQELSSSELKNPQRDKTI